MLERQSEITGPLPMNLKEPSPPSKVIQLRSRVVRSRPASLKNLVLVGLSLLTVCVAAFFWYGSPPPSLELILRVTPPDQLSVQLGDSAVNTALLSPIDLKLSGDQTLKISRAGYEPYETVLRSTEEYKGGLRVGLKPLLPPMKLKVRSMPLRAEVYINGERRGQTPLELDPVIANESGVIDVMVKLGGYRIYRTEVIPSESKRSQNIFAHLKR